MKTGTYRLAALLLTMFLQACGTGTAATTPPSSKVFAEDVPVVQSTTPANLKDGVGYNASLTVTFSEQMDPASVNSSTFMLMGPDGSLVAGTVSYSGRIAVFKPAAPLAPDTMYSATVTTGMKCKDYGNSLSNDFNWMFVTGKMADTTAPQVTLTAFAVAKTNDVYGGLVVAFFSEPMDPATISPATFLVKDPAGAPVPGTTAYIGLNAIFYPLAAFQANSTYTATITRGAQDLAGNGLARARSWEFTTPNESTLLGTMSQVTSTSPSNMATGVLLGNSINASFSQVMDPFSITPATFRVLDPDGLPVAGTISYTGTTATFTPAFPLIPDNTYVAVISSSVATLAGVHMDADYSWVFTTGTDLAGTPPVAIFTVPLQGDTGVGVNSSILVTFDEPMDPATLTTATFTVTAPDASQVVGQVTYVGMTAVFIPQSQLLPGVTYTCRVSTGATDVNGEAMANDLVWTFDTSDSFASTVPVVVFSDPGPGDVGVSLNKQINIAFNEVMSPLTITNANIIVTAPDGSVVPGTVNYLGFVAIFVPSVRLQDLTTYTVTVTTDVTDIEGIPLAAPYSFSFTTVMLL